MKPGITHNQETLHSPHNSWLPHFPNPADFRFNYFKLLKNAGNGLAALQNNSIKTVAVIGAGAAGMTAARELHRCGYAVTIYEASDRIGGRLYTRPNPNGDTQAGMEMGAMRMPFFSEPGDHNSVLGYYLNYEAQSIGHDAVLTAFPNPGQAPGGTGIYINRGHGPDMVYKNPTLIPWPQGQSPENPQLNELSKKVNEFGQTFQIPAKLFYPQHNGDWETCWQKIVQFYDGKTFNDIVLLPAKTHKEVKDAIKDLKSFDGNLGGFGMTPKQTELLYTIGTGDGSWGAFYSIGALWFLRCTYFGFDSNLRTVEGLSNSDSLPYYKQAVNDSNGTPLAPPTYEGIQSLVEYLYYVPAPGCNASLYDGAQLYVNQPIHQIIKDNGSIILRHGQAQEDRFDFVIVTASQWATQMSMEFIGFRENELPQNKITTEHIQHNISSCKLFYPLKSQYWDKEKHPNNRIPQIIVTDTAIQDAYALSWNSKPNDNGVLLASYTWEDDSLKLLPFSEQELSALVLRKIKEITQSTVGQDITQYIDTDKPVYIQWITQPHYIGCSKLYRSYDQYDNMVDLAYNQDFGKQSKLYFAGENYGVEGGWTEPALRSALDCVLQLLHHNDAKFTVKDFDFAKDYPKWPKPQWNY